MTSRTQGPCDSSQTRPPISGELWSVDDAVQAIRDEVGDFAPEVMILLGSGLSGASTGADIYYTMPYDRIPGMAPARVVGHPGKLLFGSWANRTVVLFQGRNHWYEGHPWTRVTLPIQIAAHLGVGTVMLTNASGSLSPKLPPGSLVCIDDHLNFMGANPRVGVTSNDPSTLFPDLGEAYSRRLRDLLDDAAMMLGQSLHHGVYAAVSGPNYETPAEVRALRMLGADVVGMSTVGEVIVARQCGLECSAISCVTNMAAGMTSGAITHDEVVDIAHSVSLRLGSILDTTLRLL
ncbi:Purine nucleoside phosphorylase 1 [Planctomycetes bacterium Pan216]|uniref:Purine nucleoside phosphorylase n=1 Tax=Kolteria novifilia TaxID=2527975 RepID=A0A518B6F6_9BACT|nr:Purine nucleoside phosphorylase 1 [Planctomycetes bacterium Pan216]